MVFVAALAIAATPPAHASAQVPFLVEGLVDAEGWATTAHSNLLTRNGGTPAALGRLQGWAAVEPWRGLVLYAQGDIEGGNARHPRDGRNVVADLDQVGVRYLGARGISIDAGRVSPVVGTFASRRFSNRNPLIGAPDSYAIEYPVGVVVAGANAHTDFRVGALSLPPTHDGYVPEATERLRPAVGAGVTPTVGMRLGASWTAGPYLNCDLTPTQLAGRKWSDFHQRVVALDARFARGYLETFAEAARATYDVPGRSGAIMGFAYYGEAKYTIAPRLFIAGRLERNAYPFIRAMVGGAENEGPRWIAKTVDFVDGELGAGYRVTATTLVKASLRGDRWWVAPGATGFLGQGGRAVAIQVSQSIDATPLLRGRP